jgi:hypothetical protein
MTPTEGTLIAPAGDRPTVPVTAHRDQARQRRYPTDIPQPVIDHFHAMYYQVRWGAKDEVMQGMDETLGYTPVLAQDLSGEVRDLCDRVFTLQPEGVYTRGDMILQIRTFAERDEQLAEEQEARDIMNDPGRAIEALHDAGMPLTIDPKTTNLTPEGEVVGGYTDDVMNAVEEIVAKRKAEEAKREAAAAKPTPKRKVPTKYQEMSKVATAEAKKGQDK